MDDVTLVRAIEDAAAQLDRRRAAELAGQLIARVRRSRDPLPDKLAYRALDAVKAKRYFDLVERVADALIQAGNAQPRIRRVYAQALIDQGSRTAAICVLEALVAGTAADGVENAEARGLLGRAYKQLYIETAAPELERNREVLRRAVEGYYLPYLEQPEARPWHGINTVALLHRARRDGIQLGGDLPDPDRLAAAILERIEQMEPPLRWWDQATALEACVALGRAGEATRWASDCVRSGAEAFSLGSIVRQLTEVWGLDADAELGPAVLPILRDALLQRDNGFIEVTAKEVRDAPTTLERVLGFDYFNTLGWYRNGLARARAVARIGIDASRGEGTGFLVRGGDLLERLGDEMLLVTNAHVVSDRPEHNPAVPDFRDALVTFEAVERDGPEAETYRISEVLGSSGPRECDFAVLRLDRAVEAREPIAPYEVANGLPANDGKQRLYIIGHPGGGSLSFSMHDNLLLDYDDRLMHYRTPTEGGSSGSPVFNSQWKLVGLHHAGYAEVPRLNQKGGAYAANEGISIFAIRKTLAGALGG